MIPYHKCLWLSVNGTAHFTLFIDDKGCHIIGISIYNPTRGSLQQKNWFNSTKMCFWTLLRGTTRKRFQNDNIFAIKHLFCLPYKSCPLHDFVGTFHHSLIFASKVAKAVVRHNCKGWLCGPDANIRLGWNWLTVTNTQAYLTRPYIICFLYPL